MQNHSMVIDDPSGASAGGGMSRNIVNTYATPYVLCAAATRFLSAQQQQQPVINNNNNNEFKHKANEEDEDDLDEQCYCRAKCATSASRNNLRCRRFVRNDKIDRGRPNNNSLARPSNDSVSTSSSNISLEQEVKRMLRYVRHRQDMEDATNRRIHEWRLLSMFIDKILFWIFLVVTLATSIIFLVVIPIQRRGI